MATNDTCRSLASLGMTEATALHMARHNISRNKGMRRTSTLIQACIAATLALAPLAAHAQDRLKTMPGYDQFTRMSPMYQGAIKSGSVLGAAGGRGGGRGGPPAAQAVTWSADGKSVDYSWDGKHYRLDLGSKKTAEVAEGDVAPAAADVPNAGGRGGRGGRGSGGANVVERGCGNVALPPVERGRQRPVAASGDGKYIAHYHDRNVFVCDGN